MKPLLTTRRRRLLVALFLVVVSVSLLAVTSTVRRASASPSIATAQGYSYQPVTPQIVFEDGVLQSLAQYAPWHALGVYGRPPEGCEVDQVNILQRHGARWPTSGVHANISLAISKLQNSSATLTDSPVAFVQNYTYELGRDQLIPFGAMEALDAGQASYLRYRRLISEDDIPFVRSSDSPRAVDSARNWTVGFARASGQKYKPHLNVIISSAGHSTLKKKCDKADKSNQEASDWLDAWGPPVVEKINRAAPGANVSKSDLFHLFSLCSFDSVATMRLSPWCSLFTPEEFRGFEYLADLGKYYGSTGLGKPLGRIQGVGYVNELIARLTESPVVDHTQTNATLDSSPDTFPLHRSIYADFSHDTLMVAVYGALDLFNGTPPLPATRPDPDRKWRLSRLVPFSSRMVTERLQCRRAHGRRAGKYVRIVLNEAVQPLTFCGGGSGMCSLDAFVESQAYARRDGDGDFARCFPTDHLT